MLKRLFGPLITLCDKVVFFLVVGPVCAILLFILLLRRVTINLPNNKKKKRVLCLNPMRWEWVEEKGILSHVMLLNHGDYWDHFFLIHADALNDRKITVSKTITVLEFNAQKPTLLSRLGFKALKRVLREINFLKQMVSFVKENEIDVIRSQEPYRAGMRGVILRQLTGCPLVEDIRCNYDLVYQNTGVTALGKTGILYRGIEKCVERITFRYADMVFGGNNDNRDFGIYNGANPQKTFTVRPVGVSEKHFEDVSLRKNLREELNLVGRKVMLCLSRLSLEKYPQDAVQCAALVCQGHDDAILLMVGDGVMRDKLQELAMDLGIREKVRFLGFQPENRVIDLLYTADAIISCLTGSALIEAALSTTPIVAYDFEWHSELIKDGETGILVPFRDYKCLANAVVKVLENDELAKRLGKSARELAIGQHHPDVVALQEHKCFERLFRGDLLPRKLDEQENNWPTIEGER